MEMIIFFLPLIVAAVFPLSRNKPNPESCENGLEILSCNFSSKSFSEANLASDLTQIADSNGTPHHRLVIEITERETEEQSRFAREAGGHYGQGFLFFRPMRTERVFEMMEKCSILEEDT